MKLRLRSKLLILFLLMSILVLVTSLLSMVLVRKTIHGQIRSFQKAAITSAEKIVEHYVLNCQKSLLALSSEKGFRDSVIKKDTRSLGISLRRVFDKYKTFSFLSVIVKKNDQPAVFGAYPGRYQDFVQGPELKNYLLWSFKHPAVDLSSLQVIRGKKEALIVVPMKGALLVGGIDLENIAELLEKIKPMEESTFLILDSGGNYVLGGEGHMDFPFDEPAGFMEWPEKESMGNHVYNGYLKWRIVLLTPEKILLRSLIYLKNIGFVFGFLSVIFAFILALYFSNKVTLPISLLNKGARLLGTGNLSYRIDLNTGDELSSLASEFNQMAAKLKESYDSLDEKVRRATTDLKSAYAEIEDKNRFLEEADRLKSQFLANMSHELRTPMNAIMGFTSLLMDEVYGKVSHKQKDTLGKVLRNAQHLLSLINDILDLSKIEAGRMQLYPELFKLNHMLHELKEEVEPLAREKGLAFELKTQEDMEVFHDPMRLKQVVMNLLSNAIKFTKTGGVAVNAALEGEGFFSVEVLDTGIGIREGDLAAIFDEFRQVDGSITREFGGTGLGLSISKKLVMMMGGGISAQSRPENGSSFKITLPTGHPEKRDLPSG